MKKILTVLLIAILFLQLCACSQDQTPAPTLEVCQSETAHTHPIEQKRMNDFESYPNGWCILVPYPVHIRFDSVESFVHKLNDPSFTEDELEFISKATLSDHSHGENTVGIPDPSAICDLFYHGRSITESLEWQGCADYTLTGKVRLEGTDVSFMLRYYGYENFNDSFPENAQRKDEGGDIPTVRYTWLDEAETVARSLYLYTVSEGGYTYRVAERNLADKSIVDGEDFITRQYDIEIFDGVNYYYLLLGSHGSICPKLSPEIITAFTLNKAI